MPPSAITVRRFALLLTTSVLAACGSDAAAPTAPPIARWAGSYTGQSRFGAASGTWGNGGTYPLIVTSTGDVTVSGVPLKDHTYDEGAFTLRWTLSAGNATNGEVTFHNSLTSDFFFRDLTNASAGQGFTGYIQRPGEGRLDYRGVLR
jgi:hypothetical protein